ncbi:30S ribosomal protein S20 [Candidatus Berkelbacteria bacterium]|nr:30S ribosomal protein S20 [Candidatus Berkelbacteria bacterium]
MSRTKSALKAHRVSLRRRSMNLRRTTLADRSIRTVRKAATPTADQIRTAVTAIDKSVKHKLMHWRKAARLKGQMMRTKGPKTTDSKPTKAKKKPIKRKK